MMDPNSNEQAPRGSWGEVIARIDDLLARMRWVAPKDPLDVADEMLEFLKEGEFREPGEVAEALRLNTDDAEEILGHLADADLVMHGFRISRFGKELVKLPRG